MTKRPRAPEWLSGEAASAFSRIVERLCLRGEWRDEFAPMTEVTAVACSMYARLVRDPAATAVDVEEWRQEARKGLTAMGWLQEGRSHLVAVDMYGNDGELVEICRPL